MYINWKGKPEAMEIQILKDVCAQFLPVSISLLVVCNESSMMSQKMQLTQHSWLCYFSGTLLHLKIPKNVALKSVFITYLSVQCDGTGLALGADPLWPRRVTLTARLDLTADVLQSCKLPSTGESNSVKIIPVLANFL